MKTIEQLINEVVNIDDLPNIIHYLENEVLSFEKYKRLFYKRLELQYDLKLYDQNVELGLKFYQENEEKFISEKDDAFFKVMFLSLLEVKKYDLAYQFIQLRKNVLPVLEKYKAHLDLIEFKKRTHQPYLIDLEILAKDHLPDQIKVNILNELLVIYLENQEDHKVIPLIDILKQIDPKETYIPSYLKALYNLKKYDELKHIAQKYVNHSIYDKDANLALLKIYIEENKAHQITIIDADISEKIDSFPLEYQKSYYELFTKFYQTTNNKLSFDIYQKKLKNLLKEEKKQKPKVFEVEPNQPTVIFEKSDKKRNINLEHFHILVDLIAYAHQIYDKNLRDIFRTFFIKVDEYIKVKDFIIYDYKDSRLYNYKVERLYDKVLLPEMIENTLIKTVMKNGDDVFGLLKEFKDINNVLTNKPYGEEVGYIYAYPIYDLGVFIVHLEKEIQDPGIYYDLFKGLSNIIYALMVDDKRVRAEKKENQFLENVFASPIFSLRIMSKNQSKYNISAQNLLSINQYDPLEIFLRNIHPSDIHRYESTIKELFIRGNQQAEITYHYLDKYITEYFTSIQKGEEIVVISRFENITNHLEEKNKLIQESKVDFDTNLMNFNALNDKISEYIQTKSSFMLISFNEFILPIYGYDITKQYFKEFSNVTKKFFEQGETYRFSDDKLFVYVPMNDVRTVTKLIKDYIKYMESYESQVIHYEKFQPKIAIIRYPVVTEEKLPYKLYRYLELSLDYLKRTTHDEKYVFYEHSIYENEVFEQQIIQRLNEAMENQQLNLSFNQIIDVKRNIVWQYESELKVDQLNVDIKYLLTIAKKRNRLLDLEKYHVRMVLEFLHALEQETNNLIKITIPISKETMMDPTFNQYVFEMFQKYQIPYQFIRFKVKGDQIKSNQYIRVIDEFMKFGIGMDTTSVDVALTYPFHALHLDYQSQPKWQSYIQKLKILLEEHQMAFIVRNVNKKEDKAFLENIDVRYIEGDLFKKIDADQLFYKIKEQFK